MKTLIVYYSRSNVTKKVAEYMKTRTEAHIEEIISQVNYDGTLGFVKGAKDGRSGKIISIDENKHNPADYDLVIIGGPVWASKIANPVISYVEKNKENLPDVKFFALAKSNGFDGAFQQLEKVSGKTPLKTLKLYQKNVDSGDYKEDIENFLNSPYLQQ